MSFSYRDRPSLSERLRGRSGDQLFQDLEKEIEEDRKMFFDRAPGWTTTPRSGSFSRAFPFDDTPRRQDIRSHLEDLANRHPEFADHLRCPPWGGEVGARSSRWDRKQPDQETHQDEDCRSQASNSSTGSDGTGGAEKPGGLSHHGLRNTVDIGQQQHSSEQPKEARGQRSMSAPPPDNRSQNSEQAPPPRYVTRLNITPSTNVDNSRNDQGKPPVAPKQQQQQQQQPQQPSSPKQQSGSVRHIPIFVEGRDEPILPKNVGETYTPKPPHPQHSPPSHAFGRPVFSAHNQFESPPTQKTPPQTRKFKQQPPPPQQPQSQPEPQMPQAEQPPPQPKPQHPPANDPISRVMTIQKDVDELAGKVEKFSGTSRKDKEYIYLDEMLTRNLLKLDDIETEGKENVRLARREAIKTIQNCINVLEGKVPLPEEAAVTVPVESMDLNVDEVTAPIKPSMDMETSESEVGQGDHIPVEKLETMDVEPLSADGESEQKAMEVVEAASDVETTAADKVMEIESKPCEEEMAPKVAVEATSKKDTVEEATATKDVAVEEAAGIQDAAGEAMATATQDVAGEATATKDVAVEGAMATQDIAVEGAMATQDIAGEATDAVEATTKDAVEGPVPVAIQEAVVQEQKGTADSGDDGNLKTSEESKPVEQMASEAAVSTNEVKEEITSKGSESPRTKGKGTKAKKEGGKTRKGKSGKSAERKNATEAKVEAEVQVGNTGTGNVPKA